MCSRIYDKQVEIDDKKVNLFFNQRFYGENPLASVMLRPKDGDCIAEKRNENEKNLLSGFLSDKQKISVLDLGCGIGRWASNLYSQISMYIGLDFTKKYIDFAKKHFSNENYIFFNCSVINPHPDIFKYRYDLVIINGLCVYLNDKDIEYVFEYVNSLLKFDGVLYCRETVSTIGQRITLKEFFSQELQAVYNAVYRIPDEYLYFFRSKIPNKKVSHSAFLLDDDTGARPETNQMFWFLE